jgi:hypothetical protein
VGRNFGPVGVGNVFNSADDAGFVGIAFVNQLGHAFGVGGGMSGQALVTTRLAGGIGIGAFSHKN